MFENVYIITLKLFCTFSTDLINRCLNKEVLVMHTTSKQKLQIFDK